MNTDSNSSEGDEPNKVVEKVDQQKMAQFVSVIRNAEQQVGAHVISALQHDGTVAVLTAITIGPDGQQRIVSAALSPDMMTDVQRVLMKAEEERVDEEPCVGFHCFLRPKKEDAPKEDTSK